MGRADASRRETGLGVSGVAGIAGGVLVLAALVFGVIATGFSSEPETAMATPTERPTRVTAETVALTPWPTGTLGEPRSVALPVPTTSVGGVASGFPQSPEGALAQLVTVLPIMFAATDDEAVAVGRQFTVGGSDAMGQGMVEVRDGAPLRLSFEYVPAMGRVVASTLGGDFTIACTFGSLDMSGGPDKALVTRPLALCVGMRWSQGRWVMDPMAVTEPPSVDGIEPLSEGAFYSGWKELL
jgi:hypothetical protein